MSNDIEGNSANRHNLPKKLVEDIKTKASLVNNNTDDVLPVDKDDLTLEPDVSTVDWHKGFDEDVSLVKEKILSNVNSESLKDSYPVKADQIIEDFVLAIAEYNTFKEYLKEGKLGSDARLSKDFDSYLDKIAYRPGIVIDRYLQQRKIIIQDGLSTEELDHFFEKLCSHLELEDRFDFACRLKDAAFEQSSSQEKNIVNLLNNKRDEYNNENASVLAKYKNLAEEQDFKKVNDDLTKMLFRASENVYNFIRKNISKEDINTLLSYRDDYIEAQMDGEGPDKQLALDAVLKTVLPGQEETQNEILNRHLAARLAECLRPSTMGMLTLPSYARDTLELRFYSQITSNVDEEGGEMDDMQSA